MNVLELFASLKLNKDDYENGLKDASSKASEFGSKLASGLGNATKLVAGAVTTASVATGALIKESVEAYSNYEQLVGGVQTLFGEISKTGDASATVIKNAGEAFRTAGLSANEYMETATSFAASLMASLEYDGQKAAEAADLAVRDMADNANKMGTSMQSIQNAYQGFAKGQYSMLDNLKLGYGGTKKEMERLLADAEKITGIKYDLDNLNDVYSAIHVIQTELGITGTTAKEAGTTIAGSLNAMKSAWNNLLTSLADPNADIGKQLDNLMESIFGDGTDTNLGFIGNAIPAVERAIEALGTTIEKALPKFLDRLPNVLNDVLPKLIESAINMVKSLVEGIKRNTGAVFELVSSILLMLSDALIDILPELLSVGLNIFLQLIDKIAENLPILIPKVVDLMIGLINGLVENLPLLMDATIKLVTGLIIGIINALPQIIAELPSIFTSLIDGFVNLIPDAGKSFANSFEELRNQITPEADSLIDDLIDDKDRIVNEINNIGTMFAEGDILSSLSKIGEDAYGFFDSMFNITDKITFLKDEFVRENEEGWERLNQAVEKVTGKDISGIVDNFRNVKDGASVLITGLQTTLEDFALKFVETFGTDIPNILGQFLGMFITWCADVIKGFIDFKLDLDAKFIEMIKSGLELWNEWLETLANKVREAIPQLIQLIKNYAQEWFNIGKNIVSGIWNGFTSGWSEFISNVGSNISSFVSGVKSQLRIASPSKVFAEIGEFLVAGLGQGWDSEFSTVKKSIENDLDFSAKNATMNVDTNFAGATNVENISIDLFSRISNAIEELQNLVSDRQGDIMIPVYVGNEQIDTILVNASNRLNYRSGGRVNV